jgi:YD repeat-containing protein
VTTTQQLGQPGMPACHRPPCGQAPVRRHRPRPFAYVNQTDGIERRGSLTTYNSYGQVITVLDGRGVQATADGVVSVLTATAPLYTRHNSYDPQGDQVTESTPPITTTAVGGQVLANLPVTTTYGYDGDGNRISLTSPNGYTTTYSYDHLGRLVQTTQYTVSLVSGSSAPTQTQQYDGDGNVVRSVDGNGDVTLSAYDPLGRVISTTDPVSATTLYTYTATEQQAEQDGQGNVTRYAYDAASRLITTTDPLQGTTVDRYDAVGNTVAITAAGGSPIEVKRYDGLNELITDTIEGPLGNAGPVTTTQSVCL